MPQNDNRAIASKTLAMVLEDLDQHMADAGCVRTPDALASRWSLNGEPVVYAFGGLWTCQPPGQASQAFPLVAAWARGWYALRIARTPATAKRLFIPYKSIYDR